MTLPGIYRDAEHYDLLAQMTAPKDVPFYVKRITAGPVLELGCGTGRVTLPLAERLTVTGVDFAEPLLDRARLKAIEAGLTVELVHADVRELDLKRRFPWVLFPYNGFNHMLDAESIARCFGVVAAHLTDEGRFVMDTFNPDPRRLVPFGEKVILRYRDPRLDAEVVLTERNEYDAATQVNTITWRYAIGGVEDARVDVLPMRIFFPRELEALFAMHGFRIVERIGDYDGTPFSTPTPKQITVAVCERSQ